MNRRGVSAVIGTVLILALVMAMAVIVWMVIGGVVGEAGEEIAIGRVSLDLKILGVSSNAGNLVINVQREKGKGALESIKFIVEGPDGDEELVEEDSDLSEFDTEKFTFTLKKIDPSEVVKVSIIPVLSSGTSDIKDVWEVSKRGVECVPTTSCPNFVNVACGAPIEDDCGVCQSGTGTECVDSAQECAAGVCVDRLRIFVTTGDGFDLINYKGLAGGDNLCMTESNAEGYSGTWKALIGASERNIKVYDPSDLTKWILLPNRSYYRVDGLLIGRTGDDAWFDFDVGFTNIIDVFVPFGKNAWTGLDKFGQAHSGGNCEDWTYNFGQSVVGSATKKDSGAISNIFGQCIQSYQVYCVEQPPLPAS